MHDICIIGTNPPCPRCSLLKKIVEELAADEDLVADVRHITYIAPEAVHFAQSYGLIPGTAKDVAKVLGQRIDLSEFNKQNAQDYANENKPYESYNNFGWSYGLDEFLRPYEDAAEKSGILMTPILMINGKLIHAGSVPAIENIKKWLIMVHKQ
ncbi:thioredoxin family protein [Acetobacterium wieringae]|uniref:Thioredoxin family protein n=1 Tax=Acetobacterium wieringae TaxID=52694 RepID=A0ABY6HHE2_9FIRM|nr:thioredoxin family protein [Acetobacterium wieringae]UYO63950.1 thioredoxin family protein [Acetobacterium wieringae]